MTGNSADNPLFDDGCATLVEVVLPLPLYTTFTYRVPSEMRQGARPGHRVIVPFGRKKFYTGIVVVS